jgi:transposase
MGVAIGVDSHKSSFAAAALDELGRVVGVREFPNDAHGHDALLRWIKAQDRDRVIGIEGAGSYGAGLSRHLLDAGEDVYEVPAFLSYRERKRNPSRGKSDPGDAVAIARVTARGEGLSSRCRTEDSVELKLLSDHRDQLVRARTQLINRTHKDLVISRATRKESPSSAPRRTRWLRWRCCAAIARCAPISLGTASQRPADSPRGSQTWSGSSPPKSHSQARPSSRFKASAS